MAARTATVHRRSTPSKTRPPAAGQRFVAQFFWLDSLCGPSSAQDVVEGLTASDAVAVTVR